jgi:hypothetical protein
MKRKMKTWKRCKRKIETKDGAEHIVSALSNKHLYIHRTIYSKYLWTVSVECGVGVIAIFPTRKRAMSFAEELLKMNIDFSATREELRSNMRLKRKVIEVKEELRTYHLNKGIKKKQNENRK